MYVLIYCTCFSPSDWNCKYFSLHPSLHFKFPLSFFSAQEYSFPSRVLSLNSKVLSCLLGWTHLFPLPAPFPPSKQALTCFLSVFALVTSSRHCELCRIKRSAADITVYEVSGNSSSSPPLVRSPLPSNSPPFKIRGREDEQLLFLLLWIIHASLASAWWYQWPCLIPRGRKGLLRIFQSMNLKGIRFF